MASTRKLNRNIPTPHGKTTMRLEPEFWDALRDLCQREQIHKLDFFTRAEAQRGGASLSSAVRILLIGYYKDAATDAGHKAAGHGVLEGLR